MTFREFMQENGYDLITTFWEDFSIADKYGIAGVKDTYKRAFSEWKGNYKFFTELTLVLNHKIWQHYESNRKLAALYDRLWREARPSRGTWSSPVASRAPATSTSETWFGR